MSAALLIALGGASRLEAQGAPSTAVSTASAELLTAKRMLELAALPREQFIRAWNAEQKPPSRSSIRIVAISPRYKSRNAGFASHSATRRGA